MGIWKNVKEPHIKEQVLRILESYSDDKVTQAEKELNQTGETTLIDYRTGTMTTLQLNPETDTVFFNRDQRGRVGIIQIRPANDDSKTWSKKDEKS